MPECKCKFRLLLMNSLNFFQFIQSSIPSSSIQQQLHSHPLHSPFSLHSLNSAMHSSFFVPSIWQLGTNLDYSHHRLQCRLPVPLFQISFLISTFPSHCKSFSCNLPRSMYPRNYSSVPWGTFTPHSTCVTHPNPLHL